MSTIFNPNEYLTFDDVLLKPAYSEVLPGEVDTSTFITRSIKLDIPVMSAAMDTVTESEMAIAMAQNGGIGCIHKNCSIERQMEQVRIVKKFESGIVYNPVTTTPDSSLEECLNLMKKHHISGVPVTTKDSHLVGIITNRDVRFAKDKRQKVEELMTKNNLVTVKRNVGKEEAKRLLHQYRIEKLLVVDDDYRCIGLVTVKDIEKSYSFPHASKDSQERLIVAAAIGTLEKDMERAEGLIHEDVDIIIVDTAHGHSVRVINAVKTLRNKYKDRIQIIAGNIATAEAARDLIKAGVDGVKVGIGPGSICTTRIVTGVGVPQLSAIFDCAQECKKAGVPVIADGGIRYSGDIAKAIACGASVIMGGSIFAGSSETPGELVLYQGRSYKMYRGMGSIGAMSDGSADRYFQQDMSKKKLVPEGVEGRVPFKGTAKDIIYQLIGGLRSAMGYTGNKNISEMQNNCQFIRTTSAGVIENHPHNIIITQEAPNYSN